MAEAMGQVGLAARFPHQLFVVTHNRTVAGFIADRIAMTYLGRIVEIADAEHIFSAPRHPYTQALLSAAPLPDPDQQRSRRRIVLSGDVPNPADSPPGCPGHTRRPVAQDRCRTEVPRRQARGPAELGGVACHLVDGQNGKLQAAS